MCRSSDVAGDPVTTADGIEVVFVFLVGKEVEAGVELVPSLESLTDVEELSVRSFLGPGA
jgi:hypothetical protein